jgi:hypothetical protein
MCNMSVTDSVTILTCFHNAGVYLNIIAIPDF